MEERLNNCLCLYSQAEASEADQNKLSDRVTDFAEKKWTQIWSDHNMEFYIEIVHFTL